ncbi:28 kDa inner dynein arm light chain, axonemal isoform X2 [Eurytemora carolleeae]|uniref:28 kDa inner dynein arm light chain, axonemal isoform X2 n=1 Tax=Eurytemora carolleeae TaxID=1294199 RepID=UPI000C767A3D|nr:28 kDa inner dynein arm light chain, axonemal isoform X2 [Eurytemora carolleeae]|eukprot:XP_023322056.1 28 kDa inner dynein arm light chain, axonemal-like isoform X2 [Eurytemora affinis]
MDVLDKNQEVPNKTPFSLVKYNNPFRSSLSSDHGSNLTADDLIINEIFPAKIWKEDGGIIWEQHVCLQEADRIDVIRTGAQLDRKLSEQSAREEGICQVRRELYAQCFEEIIRQTCINCIERGLLLLRVRDEMRMTIHAAETLYTSSIAFGIRQAVRAEEGKADREARVKQLEEEVQQLRLEVEELSL